MKTESTGPNISWFKRNGMNLATLIIVVSIFVQQIKWQESVDNTLAEHEKHVTDTEEHPSLENMIQLFVPRNEYNEMKLMIDMINTKVDLLLEARIKGM